MMPIFFHLESHLWLFYLLFVNGYLFQLLLSTASVEYRTMTRFFEAKVVASFALSFGFNGLVLYMLDLVNVSWSLAPYILFATTPLGIVGLMVLSRVQGRENVELIGEISALRFMFYIVVWLILFYNGGLIEQVSDAWWHMSMANKMAIENSYTLSAGHLHGVEMRWYPPLLHANLALTSKLSSDSIPVFWNSLTAWAAVVKVMVFYLFSFALTASRRTSLLASLLFVLLPGMGVSYLRVSAWPSHFAYTFMFASLFVFFNALRKIDDVQLLESQNGLRRLVSFVAHRKMSLCSLCVLALLIFFSHQLELVWLAICIFLYSGVIVLVNDMAGFKPEANHTYLFSLIFQLGVVLLAVSSLLLLLYPWGRVASNYDMVASRVIPILIFISLLLGNVLPRGRYAYYAAGALFMALVFTVDVQHLYSLFVPSAALEPQRFLELPVLSEGLGGGALFLPGWHLQLRAGLLYSGVIAIPLSLWLALKVPSRATLFLAVNGVVSILFCLSPYMYQWLMDIMSYHSPWRIATLSFTPLIVAVGLNYAWQGVLMNRQSNV